MHSPQWASSINSSLSKERNSDVSQNTWVFRWFGESAHLLERRDALTCHDIFLMKNQSIVFLHEESDGDGSVISALASRRIACGVDRATRR